MNPRQLLLVALVCAIVYACVTGRLDLQFPGLPGGRMF